MNEIDIVSEGYIQLFKNTDFKIVGLPQSGSDRKYYRITSADKSVIGAYNSNLEENEAFIGFTQTFHIKRLAGT